MFHYIYKIYIFTIILCASNLFNNNGVENGTYKLSYHNGGIQFRMLAQKNTNKKSNGNALKNILLKDKSKKGSKKKNPDAEISDLVNLVDNMNITQEKKDKIKNLSLKYINSRDVKEKNESINELQKYSNNEECKEYMDSYLMHLRMQNDIKCLKRKNLWNNIWIVSTTLLLIIIMIACVYWLASTPPPGLFCLPFIVLIFIIYIVARYFPDMKIGFKKLKTKLNTFFQNKKQITK
ncbi:Pfmc-2TM Maurer's cleft two transmembrane protein [Plasmodium falciparum NF54]|uniref:Pfmc-2TM Maurer's cleft two transmembrane protein n=2 Tax=Plasmodium falciparum TaxID=5833 RepID=B9ZSH7_PLAF7|nr:Pfmc-2TM Maurer's cleft two transmembrane protein [Plasmodium falciparum 3D7]KAF4328297.1 Pfmc-2TM Maurer's cleft two transmembrane protein [Plasmodium falciparum NF54]PKC48099.1 Pfmc-2TM Maurer's cleft two transmembrane protein [Plasmodium falciparum NF54]CAX51181.1 Pfmc-2TM Maurer's cleft two transmembrane protein [Plasmodium falciparum 3D7]|eukprot:XP_002808599.1 Pfmc-2TM Maurer's cleft two transmembrane protein [Plasmodium falciparum 3D7]